MKDMTLVATGDSFISQRLPHNFDFNPIRDIIRTGDFTFTNFEVTTPENFKYPSAVSGGTWASGPKDVIGDIIELGFNSVAWANNHTLDFSHEGMFNTMKNLDESSLMHAGAGVDMESASRPKFLNTNRGKVALISITTTFHDTWIAGEKRFDGPGRPGVNGVRINKIHKINEKELDILKQLTKKTNINEQRELDIKEGFIEEEENYFHFGNHVFRVDNSSSETEEEINQRDLERNIQNIIQAKQYADVVIVSIHSHEIYKGNKSKPAQFLERLSRAFIDAGADTIIGHGPHVIRGIEIYNGKPIFYSLGNFIFQNDNVSYLPSEFYEKYKLDKNHNINDAIRARNLDGKRGLGTDPLIWQSIIATWNFINNRIELIPIDLGFKSNGEIKGLPRVTDKVDVIKNLSELSSNYGTDIKIHKNKGIINF